MRYFIPLIIATLFSFTAVAQILTETFNTSGEGGVRYTSNHSVSGNDYFERTNSGIALPPGGFPLTQPLTNTAPQGGDYWAVEDLPGGVLTLNSVGITGFGIIDIDFFMATPRFNDPSSLRFEDTPHFEVDYQVDGGGWILAARFSGNNAGTTGELQRVAGIPAGSSNTNIITRTFTEQSINLTGISGTNLEVRFRTPNSDGSEEIAFDHIRIYGTASVNDPPVLASIEGTALSYTEGSGAQNITSSITISDTETNDITGGTAQFTAGFDATEDVLSMATQFGVTGSFAGSVLTLAGTTTLANYQTLLQSIQYTNTDATDPSLQTRTVQFQVTDGQLSNAVSRDIEISASIDSGVSLASGPVCESFETSGNGSRYQAYPHTVVNDYWNRFETASPPPFLNAIVASSITGSWFWAGEDVVNGVNPNPSNIGEMLLNAFNATGFSQFTVDIDMGVGRTGVWESDYFRVQQRMDGGAWATIIAFYDNATNNMQQDINLDGVITAADAAGPVLSNTLQTISNTFPASGTSLEIRIEHFSEASEELAFDQICVTGIAGGNLPPVLANIESADINYTEGDPATQISNTLTVDDPEDDDITSAVINFSAGFDASEDTLIFVNAGGITGVYVAPTLTLTGTGSEAAYQTALRTVTYFNKDVNDPSIATRTVRFQVTDAGGSSNFMSRDIVILDTLRSPQSLPYCESFETEGNGVRYEGYPFEDLTNNDIWTRHDATTGTHPSHSAPMSGFNGDIFWVGEDVQDGANPNPAQIGEIYFNPLDISTSAADVKVSLQLGVVQNNWDDLDYILFDYKLDAGAWTRYAAFYGNTVGQMEEDLDLNGFPDAGAPTLSTAMITVNDTIPTTGEAALYLRIQHKSDASEEIGFDYLCAEFLCDAPTASCQNITLYLDGAGNGTITAGDVDAGSTAECGLQSLAVSQTAFNCSNIGTNTVTLTITDVNDATAFCTANVTVSDTIRPVITCPPTLPPILGCSPTDIFPATLLPFSSVGDTTFLIQFMVEGGIATDNCAVDTLFYIDTATGVGVHPIIVTRTFRARDNFGNTSAPCVQTFTIEDTTPPTIPVCPPTLTVEGCTTDDITNDAQTALPFSPGPSGINSAQFTAEGGTWADNCNPQRSITYQDVAAGTIPEVVTRTFTVQDFGFNTVQCVQTITLVELPTITCAADPAPVPNEQGLCGADVTVIPPQFTCCDGDEPPPPPAPNNDPSLRTASNSLSMEQTQPATAELSNKQRIISELRASGVVSRQPQTAEVQAKLNTNKELINPTVLRGGDCLNPFADESFEAGTPNGSWAESSTNFGTPLCDLGTCGFGAGTGPNIGDWWAWFGGIIAYEEGAVSQSVTIPTNAVSLDFYLEIPVCDGPADYLEVTIDGNQEFIVNGGSALCGIIGYTLQSIDISAYADGASHTIEFHSEIFSNNGGFSNFFVDDVDIICEATCVLTNDFNGTDDASGFYPVGSTSVTWTITDPAGNTATCQQTVVVNDTEPPVITCPGDITQDNDQGQCGAIITYAVSATDNCPFTGPPPTNNLSLGDITFTHYESDNPDQWSFVALVDIANGTVINFTDHGWFAVGGFRTTEGVMSWTANSDVLAGTVVEIEPPGASTGTIAIVDSGLALATSGDQLFAYQGALPTAGDMSGFLAAIQMNGAWDADATSSNTSAQPSVFTDGVNSISIAPEIDNAKYNCSVISGDAATVRAAINTSSNWTVSNSSLGGFTSCAFTISMPSPSSPQLLVGLPSGSLFPVGTTTVSHVIVDDAGNSDMCSFNVTVNEVEPPTITCPANITVSNDPGQCNADVTVPLPTFDDNCFDENGCLQTDDLEGYTLGPILGQDPRWPTWTPNTPSESGEVSNEQALSGTQSVKITGTPDGLGGVDQMYNLGDRTSGVWEVTYNMFVPVGNSAYTNFQKTQVAATEWAHEIAYHSDGTGDYHVNGTLTSFTYPQGDWFEMRHYIDLNTDTTEVFLNGVSVIGHPYTWTYTTTGGLNQLGAIDFFPITSIVLGAEPNPTAIPLYYVDDVSLCAVATNDYNDTTDASDNYEVGTTTVVWTITDGAGNTATCDHTITVNDDEDPVAICPGNITQSIDEGECGAIVSFDISATDNCPGVSVASVPVSGSFFDVGTTTVTVTATDVAGNSDVCTFDVTVNDDEDPVATCPEDITQSNDPGECGAIVSFDISATDNCPGVTVASVPVSGSFFDVGTTTVTVTATDVAGNSDVCTFDVTVNDDEDPVATCPEDITQSNDPGECGAIVSFNFSATDNCPGVTVVSVPVSGSFFDVGTTTVTVTATDGAGNSDVCTFDVTVNDDEDPVVTCPANITQSNDPGECGAIVEFTPTATDNCPGVTVVSVPPSGSFFDVGTTTVTVTATDVAGNSDVCTFDITVNDDEDPVVTCPADILVINDPGDCGAIVTFTPTATDNCPGVTVVSVPASGSFFIVGTTEVTVTATDVAGNSDVCTFDVQVLDTEPPVVTCPEDITVSNDPGECGAIVTYNPTATDNCEIADLIILPPSGSFFDVGTTLVQVVAIDVNGNASTCSFNVTVNDDEDPVAICPEDITQSNDEGECGAIVSFDISATDNCPDVTVVSVPASGSFFDVGTTTVTVTATDVSGNSDVCTFDVTVNDDEDPVAICPEDITQSNDPGECGANVSFEISATDNCPEVTVVSVPASGSFFDVGTTTVTVTATDVAGNSDVCTFDVTVNDDEDPVVTCPANITKDNDPGECGAIVEFTPTATDNCPGVTVVSVPASGSFFVVGTTEVTVTATDVAGNSDVCTFDVTVNDVESPIITCPQDITGEGCVVGDVLGVSGLPLALVPTPVDVLTFIALGGTYSDNCSSPTESSGVYVDVSTPFGVLPIVVTRKFTLMDAVGNPASCTQIITLEDTTNPIAVCEDVTLFLNHSGSATLYPIMVGGNSTDNCIKRKLRLDRTQFGCADVGENTVTLTVTDLTGNTATCTATVTVVDDWEPNVICMDASVPLGPGGTVTITPALIDNGTYDACGIDEMIVVPSEFDIDDIGPNDVALIAFDVNGNIGFCFATVTILPPVAIVIDDDIETEDPPSNNSVYQTETEWIIYPNPTSSQLSITNSTDQQIDELMVIDVVGKQVTPVIIDKQTSSQVIDVSHLAKGAYFVIIQSGDTQEAIRFIKH